MPGLILPLIASATATLLFRQFFLTIPDELVEAARVDGAGPWRFFKDILLPLSRTNIAALFVILFIYGWTQYLWPLLVTNRNEMNTIVIALRKMISFADADTPWHLVMVTCDARHPAADPRGRPDAALVRARAWSRRRSSSGRRSIAERRPQGLCRRVEVVHGVVDRHRRRRVRACIVGPSGCGKSTLLRMIAGLEAITAGTISIGGRVVNELEPRERDIAMVFQNYALYPHMTVLDNMAYGLQDRRHAEGRDRRAGSTRPRAMLELEPYLDRKPRAALRRPAPARRDGPRDRARAGGLPVRRAAVQPRRQAARCRCGCEIKELQRRSASPRSTSPTTRSRR